MCNMAAYTGNKPAVKELIELLRVQEGLAGGHFTGITTLHEGKLYMAKVCGDVDDLLKKTNVLELPGTTGIAHSRTPGYADDSWAQPFLASDESTVFCANGIGAGNVLPFPEDTFQQAEKILAESPFSLSTGVEAELPPYPRLSDGKYYHSTEIESALIAEFHRQGSDIREAVKQAFAFMPTQIASLAMAADEPETVTVMRYNQSLFYGRRDDGFCIATSCTAFQDLNYNWFQPVPVGTVGKLTAGGISFEMLGAHLDKLVISPDLAAAAKYFDQLLEPGKPLGLLDMFDQMVKNHDISPEGFSCQDSFLLYTYLAEKLRRGEVSRSSRQVPGSRPGSLRTETTFINLTK